MNQAFIFALWTLISGTLVSAGLLIGHESLLYEGSTEGWLLAGRFLQQFQFIAPASMLATFALSIWGWAMRSRAAPDQRVEKEFWVGVATSGFPLIFVVVALFGLSQAVGLHG